MYIFMVTANYIASYSLAYSVAIGCVNLISVSIDPKAVLFFFVIHYATLVLVYILA